MGVGVSMCVCVVVRGSSVKRANMWISLSGWAFKSGSERAVEENTDGEQINRAIWVTNAGKSLEG